MRLTNGYDRWEQQMQQKWLAQGIEQGIERGIERGIEKGESLVLQRLLVRRFGQLPATVVGRISAASADELDVWIDRVLDARCLDEVFSA